MKYKKEYEPLSYYLSAEFVIYLMFLSALAKQSHSFIGKRAKMKSRVSFN